MAVRDIRGVPIFGNDGDVPPIGGTQVYNEQGTASYKQKKPVMPGIYDVCDYGAIADYDPETRTGTDNIQAFNACLAAAKKDTNNGHATILIHGYFYLSETWHIRQAVSIIGTGNSDATAGVRSTRSGPGSWLVVPKDVDGIHFHPQTPSPEITGLSLTRGSSAGGDTVVITGISLLSGETTVKFGAKAATAFTSDSYTQITATSPAGTGTVDVVVTTSYGTSVTGPATQFSYGVIGAPQVTGLSLTSGSRDGGDPIVITGTAFTGATAVLFGPNAATAFTVDSDTQITATSPAGVGTVDVVMTTPAGTSANGPATQFSYGVLGAPQVTGLDLASGSRDGGDPIVITGTAFTDATTVMFGPNAAPAFIVDSDTQITATSPAGIGTVDVIVITPAGTSVARLTDQFSYLTFGGADYSTIQNLTLFCKHWRDGDFPQSKGNNTGNGIIIRCLNVHVDHVTVSNFAENGIYVSAGSKYSDSDEDRFPITRCHPDPKDDIYVFRGAKYSGNAGHFRITGCSVDTCGMNGYLVEGRDATCGLVSVCAATVNHGWGFMDTTIGNTYVALHAEGNRGFCPDLKEEGNFAYSEYFFRNGGDNNSSILVGCYAEGRFNHLDFATQCIGGGLALKQFQMNQDGTQGVSSSIGPQNAVSGIPLSWENAPEPDLPGSDKTRIEFGRRIRTGVAGVVLDFSTPGLGDYNLLRWDSERGWWGIHNSHPTDHISIRFPTTRTAPRRIAPLFENGIFFGSAKTLNAVDTSKALVNHTAMSEVPSQGTWEQGDIVWNSEPAPGRNLGWVCTTAGTYGEAPDRLVIHSNVAANDVLLPVSEVTDLLLWQYFHILESPGKYFPGIYQIASINLPTIVIDPPIVPDETQHAPQGDIKIVDAIAVVGKTARLVSTDGTGTILTLNKIDGLVPGLSITIGSAKETYKIGKINPPTIGIAGPGVSFHARSGAKIHFSPPIFSPFSPIGPNAMRLKLNRHSLTNVDDAAGRWQFEGGEVFQEDEHVANYATTRRVVILGTEAQNTAMTTLNLFFLKPEQSTENITLQGSHDFGSGNEIGSVSAASSTFADYIGKQFSRSGSDLIIGPGFRPME
jgi:hypothetical protein